MISTTLNAQERLDWLRLIRSDHVGPITFHHLLQRHGSAAAALDALVELAQRNGRKDFKTWTRAAAERELAAVHRLGGRLVAWGEPDYPPLLLPLEDAPPLLTLVGDAGLLADRPVIGVVGARNASAATFLHSPHPWTHGLPCNSSHPHRVAGSHDMRPFSAWSSRPI